MTWKNSPLSPCVGTVFCRAGGQSTVQPALDLVSPGRGWIVPAVWCLCSASQPPTSDNEHGADWLACFSAFISEGVEPRWAHHMWRRSVQVFGRLGRASDQGTSSRTGAARRCKTEPHVGSFRRIYLGPPSRLHVGTARLLHSTPTLSA
jgi:hypothetical protein